MTQFLLSGMDADPDNGDPFAIVTIGFAIDDEGNGGAVEVKLTLGDAEMLYGMLGLQVQELKQRAPERLGR